MYMTANGVERNSEHELRVNFLQAMRRLIATVTIITAGDEAARAGMVATAVMSVSADPPSLVVGINRESGVWQAVKDTGRFSVNLLGTHHTGLVHPFSGQLQGEERFTLGQWHRHASQTPYLADAVVSLFCRVDGSLDYGTHTLFVGAVDDIRIGANESEPLLWRNGSFANAVPLDELLD
jgi:flavin reductase (DIM6/NTAB) family NADH-FMN oxidoreductase RutF